MTVEMTPQPGASVARIAREHNLNDNMVFKWRRRYRHVQAKAKGLLTEPGISHTELLPVNIVDAGISQSAIETYGAVPASCEVEIEVGNRRVRIRGLSMDRAEQFLRDCLR
ncbi:transposase [Paraburkholderia sediminicola]|jgi:transposase|nr:transposase [Paraburkholderia sediminicola]